MLLAFAPAQSDDSQRLRRALELLGELRLGDGCRGGDEREHKKCDEEQREASVHGGECGLDEEG